MKYFLRFFRFTVILMVGLSIAFLPMLAQANQGTSFRNISPNDPKRQVIQTVLGSSHYSMKSSFGSREWTSGHYGGAWQRARQYFPNHMFYVESDQYFMTHGFTSEGKLYMQVFNSWLLQSCAENHQTFTNQNIVSSYNQMISSGNQQAVSQFQEKLGQLESYFRDEASKNRLKKMLGKRLYNQLLKELREENYHMFAAALLHEGMHAKMDDDATVARIQNDYKSCKLPVQWDEQRAYMAEISYHCRYYNWAVNNINYQWGKISNLLNELERFRNKPKPLSEADKEKIEQIKAKIKAHIALIRLRLREINQSVQRMTGLLANFKKEYVKDNAPADARESIDKLAASVAMFATQVGQTIQNTEALLKQLEQLLHLWNEWAKCNLDKPPSKEAGRDIIKQVRRISWPAPPIKQVEEIKKKAEGEIVKSYGAGPTGSPPGVGQGVTFSGGYQITSVSMDTLNDYIATLNTTWLGNVPGFDWNSGFRLSLGWRFSPNIEVGAAFERQAASTSGVLALPVSQYTSEQTLSGYGVYITALTNEVTPGVRLTGQFGLSYYHATYTETEDAFVTEGTDNTIGWTVAAGMDYALGGNYSFTLQAGYRSAALDDFGVSFFIPGNPPVTLEFSGFYGQVGFSIRF